ncbi:hypothetical protein PDIG_88000 [Penicillium digitatum PHI26]|uniref:Uncharacterized protein n=2 Tax=Penicillium digitatum TaxID=36651 RepID=K9FPG5_PEND2|nr:hypothetical protein PDIP_34020 [Penicillium digitatum Pd1]EKV04633.1 hypothetical protein PDIG_88000 [Penicillium digitatum PHI26]EKV16814.1 hypothetical protein PDIP_34020 [Penicillium digitatum Pd1]
MLRRTVQLHATAWLAESHKEDREIERGISSENGCSTVSSQSGWNIKGQDGRTSVTGHAKF